MKFPKHMKADKPDTPHEEANGDLSAAYALQRHEDYLIAAGAAAGHAIKGCIKGGVALFEITPVPHIAAKALGAAAGCIGGAVIEASPKAARELGLKIAENPEAYAPLITQVFSPEPTPKAEKPTIKQALNR